MDIGKIDRKIVAATIGGDDFFFWNVTDAPFALEGLPCWGSERRFYRLPSSMTETDVNAGALELANHTAGVCVRFCTDSPLIALRATLVHGCDMNHMPRLGSCGFDLYRGCGNKRIHWGSAQPQRDQQHLELVVGRNPECKMEEWQLNFPLYGGVSSVEIGLVPGSVLEAPACHAVSAPVLFYGSSITQGGCASRPGNAYTSMLCRAVDAPQINLGFSGCGRGEPAMARFIGSLSLSCFVMDYDHNAPDVAHLAATHEPFFKIVRAAQPELPIILMSRCDFWENADCQTNCRRRAVIAQTYEHAREAGDRHVWFIDGATLFGDEDRNECTVDRCHPNDLGFYRMFRRVLPFLSSALGQAADHDGL